MLGAPLPELLATIEEINVVPLEESDAMYHDEAPDRLWEDELVVIKALSASGVETT
jgi:hypothetical protein